MSTFQRMTLIGMYNYDSTLFDNMTLPTGYDRSILIDTLLLEHGEKCVMYTDPDFMKFSIGVVSRKWNLELERIYEALMAEYNPIYNYDRYEQIDENNTKKTKMDATTTRKPDLTHTDQQTVDGTTERKVSAFDSSSYDPSEKNTYNNGTTKRTETGNETTRTAGDMEDTAVKNWHHAHLYGNIGVTTSAAMVNEVVDQRRDKNLYGIAAEIFAKELTLAIY